MFWDDDVDGRAMIETGEDVPIELAGALARRDTAGRRCPVDEPLNLLGRSKDCSARCTTLLLSIRWVVRPPKKIDRTERWIAKARMSSRLDL